MSKLSPKAREAVKAAYSVKDRANSIDAKEITAAIDTTVNALKAGNIKLDVFSARMADITAAFVFVSENAPKFSNDVDYNAASTNSAFSSKVTDNSRPRTNKDVKPSKLKRHTGRDAIRRAKAARAKDIAKAPGRLTADTYLASREVTQTAKPLSTYEQNRANRASVQTNQKLFVEEFYAAKAEAPTTDKAIAKMHFNAQMAEARRNGVQVVRDVKPIS